jgi:hypothetical protein
MNARNVSKKSDTTLETNVWPVDQIRDAPVLRGSEPTAHSIIAMLHPVDAGAEEVTARGVVEIASNIELFTILTKLLANTGAAHVTACRGCAGGGRGSATYARALELCAEVRELAHTALAEPGKCSATLDDLLTHYDFAYDMIRHLMANHLKPEFGGELASEFERGAIVY